MKKRILSCLLLAAMLTGITACGSETPSDTSAADPADSTTPAETEPAMEPPAVEKCNYENAPFTIAAPEWGMYARYYYLEEQTGEAMDDAIYERIRMTEEYLGVDIKWKMEGTIHDTYSRMYTSVMADDEAFQLMLTHCLAGLPAMVSDHLLYDWQELPEIDLGREYWNQSCNENLTVFGKQYYAVSDYILPDPNCIVFNKEIIADYQLDNPYELVREGKWTLDKMFEMSEAAADDLNGDSKYDANDQYGFVGLGDWLLNSFFYSCGVSLTERTEDGGFAIALNNERTLKLIETFDKAINGSTHSYLWGVDDGKTQVTMRTGRALFEIHSAAALNSYRDCEIDIGAIPYPKMDEDDTTYSTNDWSGLMCVPVNVHDPELVGKVCEMMAYYSNETTVPAYLDLVLGEKFARDEDTREMLELIFDNIVYDAGITYGVHLATEIDNLFYTLPRLVYQKASGDFASWYDTHAENAQWYMDKFLKDLKN